MEFNDYLEEDYMNYTPILIQLKKGLLEANSNLSEDDFGSTKKREKNYKEFYLKNYENNCFDTPVKVKLGSGKEAVKSSAAFIYNIFGKDTVIFEKTKYKAMKYEQGLIALLDRPKAQLDGYLLSENEQKELFFETKLLEWSGSPKNLATAYLDERNYPKYNKHKKEFISFFKSIVNENKKSTSKGVERVSHVTKVYDVIQMTIHILGIYNTICEKEYKISPKIKTNNIELINLVWDYDHPRYKKEAEEAKNYIKKLNEYFVPIFKSLNENLTFKVCYYPFSEFIKKLNFTNKERLEYLKKRYLFSSIQE